MINITTPLTNEKIKKLNAGNIIYLSGTIYTARDEAHKRLVSGINGNEKLPFELENQVIFYTGPTPKKPGQVIGSCGPTTSYRMDDYTPTLLDMGLKGMIGKGERSQKVIEKIKDTKSVYFISIGGVAALNSSSIKKAELVCYKDLGPEAILKIKVENMKLIVAIDSDGNTIFDNYLNYKR